jgi:hypothetical protein
MRDQDILEHENIKDYDWRLQYVSTLKWDQTILWNFRNDWTPVSSAWFFDFRSELVNFLIPNMSALFLDYANTLYNETTSFFVYRNFKKTNTSWVRKIEMQDFDIFFNVLQKRIWSIVFAFMALESFINDSIPEDYIYINAKKKSCDKKYIEEKFSMNDKIKIVMRDVYNIQWDISPEIWARYERIKKLRDRVVHLKQIDKTESWPKDETIWKMFLLEDFENYSVSIKTIIGYFITRKQETDRWYRKCPF